MVLGSQAAYQFACHYERLLVGKTNLLVCLDCLNRGAQSGEAHHCRQHHVYRTGGDNLVNRLLSGIYVDVGTVGKRRLQFVVVRLIGNHHGGWQFLHPVVCREAIYFI